VEIISNGHTAPPGTEGEIFITDLTNFGFPQIRNAIEDHGGWVGSACSCGRDLALMSHGVGRLCDQYVAPDGTRHSVLALSSTIADSGPSLGPIQYIQKSLTRFHLLVTNDPPVTDQIEQHIRQVIHRLVSPDIEVTIQPVEELPREPSGKIRYCICEVNQDAEQSHPAGD
jgi:phenylacetate-CoA ligase